MFILTLKLAIRNILRNRLFSVINILGLSLGLAAILYVSVLVNFETGFDKFHPEGERIYRVNTFYTMGEQKESSGFCWAYVVSDMMGELSGVEDFCRVSREMEYKVLSGDQHMKLDGVRYADQSFFDFFNFKLLRGSKTTLFADPGSIALTETEAKRLFGDEDPIGKSFVTSNKQVLTVNGILEDPSPQTHLKFKSLVSFKTAENDPEIYMGWDGGATYLSYIKLGPHVSPESIDAQIPDYLFERINKKYEPHGWKVELQLQKLQSIHLGTVVNHDVDSNRNPRHLWLFCTIALVILLLAIINYINLTSALLSKRVHEVGVRKVMGASRSRIMAQFLAESVAVTGLAMILAIIWLKSFYIGFNRLLNADFILGDFNLFLVGVSVCLVLVIGLAAGVLPALFLSKQKTITALRKLLPGGSKQFSRNGLIVFQFGIAIILVSTFLLISKQTRYMLSKDLGFRSENIVGLISDKGLSLTEAQLAKEEFLKIPEVKEVCIASQMPGRGVTGNGYKLEGSEEVSILNIIYTDGDFLNCFEVPLVEGRDFRENLENEKNCFLVNEALVRFANWEEPVGKTINRRVDHEVIGVFKDFHFSSLQETILPLVISVNPQEDGWKYHSFNILYQTDDVPALIEKLNKIWIEQLPGVVFDYQFLDSLLDQNFVTLKSTRKMLSIFTILAFLIAGIGLFGLSAFMTQNRSKEIGIRKVNGARVIDILYLLTRNMVKWVLLAFVLACPAAWYIMSKWLESFPYKTEVGTWVFIVAGLGAIALAVITISLESFRIALKNPVETLRYE